MISECPRIRPPLLRCLVLNGFLFVGFHLFFTYFTKPFIQQLLAVDSPTSTGLQSLSVVVGYFVDALYYITWVFPLYFISLLLNFCWYADIASLLHKHDKTDRKKKTAQQRPSAHIADAIYGFLLSQSFLIQIVLLSLVPFFGKMISFVYFCWLYSFSSMEYRLINLGWPLPKRLEFFEKNYIYYLGYGTPFTVVYFTLPYLVSIGITSCLFPLFIILAQKARPRRPAPGSTSLPDRFGIFRTARAINDNIFYCFFLGLLSER